GGPPDDGAVVFVEGDKAIATLGLIAPARVDHAEDGEVFIDDRTGDAAAVALHPAILFTHRALPDEFARFTVETDEQALRAVGVDVTGRRVGREIGPAEPARDDVGVEDGKAMFPDLFAVLGVQAQDAFLNRFVNVLARLGLV